MKRCLSNGDSILTMTTKNLIIPDWPAPNNVKAISTTRQGGFSQAPYDLLNLGTHVGDELDIVMKNRQQLTKLTELPESPRWLEQVHGTNIINSHDWLKDIQADAIYAQQIGHVCTVMTADCLPLLLCNQQGDMVAAIHVGWRGLAAGIIEKTLDQFSGNHYDILAWLGPAIGPRQFEVGSEVYEKFISADASASQAFIKTDDHHYLADLYTLARQRLQKYGVENIFGGKFCTVTDKERFFSYRRDGITGRMASMIWITDK